MGRTIQAESHTVKLQFVHAAERDQTVLEYWDQPGSIELRYSSKQGPKVTVVAHTPNFFVLWTRSAGWVECKPEARLRQLGQDAPNQYQRDAEGQLWVPAWYVHCGPVWIDLPPFLVGSVELGCAAQLAQQHSQWALLDT